MNSLPEVARGPVHYRLPLAEATALRLADVLLAGSDAERLERLEIALADDAPLAIWAVLLAPQPANPAQPLPDVAAWLAPRLAQVLANSPATGNGSGDAAAGPSIESTAGGPRALGAEDRDRRFIALLSEAARWLVECGTPKPDHQIAIQALPAWLTSALERVEFSSVGGAHPRRHEQLPSASSGQWQELLSRLANQVVRLAALEADLLGAAEREKLAALKEFAYGAGHEINNPLANISARAQTLLKEERDPERRQKLAAINSQAFRAHEMIADLMLFAQPPEWHSARVVVAPLVEELQQTWSRQASDQGTALRVQIVDDSLIAWADRAAIAVALKALVANALEALGRGGTIEITVQPARLAADTAIVQAPDAVAIRVRDDGPGIDPAARPRIFDPFFSGREAGRGLGFGLPKCWRIVTALGGRIDVASEASAGATFTVVLPLAAAAS
jgi:signal transduction histidine kinase